MGDGLPIDPPLVGTGSFTFATDPGDGTFALTSLGAFSMSFMFGPVTFTETDITTPLGEILVVLSSMGLDRRAQFSNNDPSGFGNGGFNGSIDFVAGTDFLSFEPPGFGGTLDLYILDGTVDAFGNYLGQLTAAAVPEPGLLPLMGIGLLALFGASRRRLS